MQFAYDWSQYRWDHYFLPALRRYYEIYGHTDVPQGFQIPENDDLWPQKLWNLKLANRVHNIRCRGYFAKQVERDVEKLTQIAFCLDSTCCEPWPKATWGLALGVLINNMRNNNHYSERVAEDRAELDAIGFVWDHYEATWNKYIFPALKTYSAVNGNCEVPKVFVVPDKAPWPENTHGLKLGITMVNVRCYGQYFDQTARNVDELQAMGFRLLIPQVKWKHRVEPLLKVFEQVFCHRDIPHDFVVPSEEPWDENSWGIQLGKLKLSLQYAYFVNAGSSGCTAKKFQLTRGLL
ncbi:hypothetical protein JM16_009491 [Phytophthora kernoviae]|uniref:Helicase-associated domain-containing protein n=1 Tax=Phytophthora kernoviae TaxID=325452 RepID=A0A8T0LI15_9STRA|nr:hypothetical protein JM16_009491 [Phytophthora kernoviae]